MHYHKWPENGVGTTEAYYTDTKGIYVESRNLNHPYLWDKMSSEFPEYEEQVSTLMADIGAAFKADYTKKVTGSIPDEKALYSHFSYHPEMFPALRKYYTEGTWLQMLKEELSSFCPVLYAGYIKDGAGHDFVLDGYTEDDYFHVNWGWYGECNGYYTLSALAPYLYKEGFNEEQSALFNFKPNTSFSTVPNDWIQFGIHPGLTDGGGIDIPEILKGYRFRINGLTVKNLSAVDFEGIIRGAVTDKEGNIKEWITDNIDCSLSVEKHCLLYDWHLTAIINNSIEPEDRIRFFYKHKESDTWNLIKSSTQKCNWEVVISDKLINIEDKHNWIQPRSSGLVLHEIIEGHSFFIDTLSVKNSSFVEFIGILRGAVTDKDGNIKEWITENIDCAITCNDFHNYKYQIEASITTPVNSDDRIRFFYRHKEANTWNLIKSSDGEDCNWEVVIGDVLSKIKIEDKDDWLLFNSPGIVIPKIVKEHCFSIEELWFHNSSSLNFEGQFRGAVTDKDGNIKEWITNALNLKMELPIKKNFRYRLVGATINNPTNPDDRIRFFYKHKDSDNWFLIKPKQQENCNWEIVLGDNIPSEVENWVQIKSPGIVMSDAEIIEGQSFCIDTLYVHNPSFVDFKGELRGAVTDKEGNIKEWITDTYQAYWSALLHNKWYCWCSINAVINNPISVGDRIRFFYKSIDSETWHLIKPQDGENSKWEIPLHDECDIVEAITPLMNDIPIAIFTTTGQKVSNTQKGQIYIFRYKNGTIEKKLVK